MQYNLKYSNLNHQIENALIGRDATNNPFVFFTKSFLYVLQHAIKKAANNEHNVKIECIDTRLTSTPHGERVRRGLVDRVI